MRHCESGPPMTRRDRLPRYDYPFVGELRLHSFKSVAGAGIKLAPLTLLVGENSSGKTSILQAIRLIQQAIEDQRANGTIPLNGDRVSLGRIENIRTASTDPTRPILIGVDLIVPDYSRVEYYYRDEDDFRQYYQHIIHADGPIPVPDNFVISWEISLGDRVEKEIGSAYIENLRFGFAHLLQAEPYVYLELQRMERDINGTIWKRIVPEHEDDLFLLCSQVLGTDSTLFYGKVEGSGLAPITLSSAVLTGSLPTELAVSKRQTQENYKAGLRHLSSLKRMFGEISSRYSDLVKEHGKASVEDMMKFSKKGTRDLSEWERTKGEKTVNVTWGGDDRHDIDFMSQFFRWWFSEQDIHYLGPLREEPRPLGTSHTTSAPKYIGQRGELIEVVLRNLGTDPITVPLPGELLGRDVRLIDAVQSWAAHLGLVEKVEIEDRAEYGLTVMVKPHGMDSTLPLSAVGVGVSQLLPVLVLCLLSEPGSVILLEQPELHLHPALQQRLADFLIAIARSGRQVIVETHSEYMVSRLRRRIVEDADDELLSMSKVIFAERDHETGLSSYRDVELTPYGGIDEWPEGFFDQASEEERAIIIGGLRKRRQHADRLE